MGEDGVAQCRIGKPPPAWPSARRRFDLRRTEQVRARRKASQAGVNITAHRHPAPGAPIQDRLRLPLRSHDFADVCELYLAEFIQQSLRAASFSIFALTSTRAKLNNVTIPGERWHRFRTPEPGLRSETLRSSRYAPSNRRVPHSSGLGSSTA